MADKPSGITPDQLRSRLWFDNPDNPGMTALYLERYLNFGLTGKELQSGKPIIGIAQTGSDLSPCNRHHLELAKRVRDGITAAGGVAFEFPVPPDPGDRQAADRLPRPQPVLPLPRRGPLRLPARRGRAADRLRQDHAGLPDGGRDREHPGDLAQCRADAQRLAPGRAHRLRHGRLEGARAARGRRHRLPAVHRHRRLLGALGRPLQHHGHGLDHERARRGARHVACPARRRSRRPTASAARWPTRPAGASSRWSGRT